MTWTVESLPDGSRIASDGEKRATVERGELRICWQEDGREIDFTDAPTIPLDVLRKLVGNA